MAPKKIKVRDKYYSEDDPLNDIDFIEVSLPEESFDQVIRKYGNKSYLQRMGESSLDLDKKASRNRKLWNKLWKAASTVLTDKQFRIYVERNILKKKEVAIAKTLGVNQSYISNVLKVSNKKIRKVLKLNEEKK